MKKNTAHEKSPKIDLVPLEWIALAIMLISVTAVFAPKFYSLYQVSMIAAEKQDVSRIKMGISNYYLVSMLKTRTPLFPENLDSAAVNKAASESALFVNVLDDQSIISGRWRKVGATSYLSYSGKRYTYNPVSGEFN